MEPSHTPLDPREADSTTRPDVTHRLRRVVQALSALVALLLVLAVVLNWLVLRTKSYQFAWRPTPAVATEYQPSLSFDPETSAVDMLPSSVIAYETIARHPVPGAGDRAAEALYATLNMNLEIMRPISLYARVELFNTAAEAASALEDQLAPYKVRASQVQIGSKVASTGYSDDEGTWAVGWAEGQSYTFVKASFKDVIPAQKRTFLHDLGRPLAEGIDKYQRTGEQGATF